ncbi:AMP-binding protein [Massilia sp. Mn16-1_5]|uniref:AMP-binding protein n=1 Tax=Massilia sp. Mn16-1_5 TaxID=2079199 RepID=UPI00109E95CB|nr:AMP-binding protein [Massilia sp. Mn16-1_5]THC46584.1 4-coumarate--CoA ligase [Massilia sp. Mn16-1_5]
MAELWHPAWWRIDEILARLVRDLVAAELAAARPGRSLPAAASWARDIDLAADLGADSLDLMGAATSLADLLGFARAGMEDALLAQTRLTDWVATARASLARDDTLLTFRTSGSAGSPKRCAHSLAHLWREVDELARLLPGRRRVLTGVPAHHIYGFLFTVLLPQAGQCALPVLDLRGASPATLAAQLAPGDLVVAHPDFWNAVAALSPRLPADVAGVSSGAPCPDATADALAGAGLRLLQVYGSSETAGVGTREAAGAPYRLLPYWRRGAAENTIERGDERFSLQDRLEWLDAQHFLPRGRIDQAVQVGGTNVYPAYVAEVLALHPAVRECVVRAMRPDEGARLKAFVVAADGHAAADLRAELDAWIAERLTPPERPAAYSFGPALPRQPGGKPADWVIDAWA